MIRTIIKNIISHVFEEYWIPYDEIESNIINGLQSNGIEVKSVFCTGEIFNLYVYIQLEDGRFFLYNRAEDKEHAYLLLENSYYDFEYFNNIAEVSNCDIELNTMPKVTLVNMCVVENFPIPRFNLSTGAIASYVRLFQKARVYIIDMQLRYGISDIVQKLEDDPPSIIGISISFGQKVLSDELLELLLSNQKLKNCLIVVGNVIPSLYYEEYLRQHPELVVSYKEGEESFIDIIDYIKGKIPKKNIRGIAYLNPDQTVVKNPIGVLDMSELPFPALDTIRGVIHFNGAMTLELSRGCNYSKCTFCPRSHKGIQWRSLSTKRMISYFKLYADLCIKLRQNAFFYIADEEFIGQLPHNKELERITTFCNEVKRLGLKIRFDISARVDSIYKPCVSDEQNIEHLKMWKMLKEIGLHRLFLGVESGSNNQLRRFNKGTNSLQNAMAISLVTALGINIRFGYITFDPLMESITDIIESHAFVEKSDVLYNPVDTDKYSVSDIYYSIIGKKPLSEITHSNVPLYTRISYPLTSLEILFSTKYAYMLGNYQVENNNALIKDIDLNMARYKTGYVNYKIGLLSDSCQRWIDYNFPILYTLKGLYKTSYGESKDIIFSLMEESKSIDHYLLNYLLFQLGELSDISPLECFVKRYDLKLTRIDCPIDQLLFVALNDWQLIEFAFIKKVESFLRCGKIIDTTDSALHTAIIAWRTKRGNWKTIN